MTTNTIITPFNTSTPTSKPTTTTTTTTISLETNPKIPIPLTGILKTLQVPPIALVYEITLSFLILGDSHVETLSKLSDIAAIPTTPLQNTDVSLRTKHFDKRTPSFLKSNVHTNTNTNSTILYLARSLDSHIQRVNWGERMRWIDIDLRLLNEGRESYRYRYQDKTTLYSEDVTNESWIRDLNINIDTTGPVLVLKSLTRPESMCAVRNTGALFESVIDDPITLEDLHPGLKLVENVSLLLKLIENVSLLLAPGTEKFPLLARLFMWLCSWFQGGRDSARLSRFRISRDIE